MTASQSCLSPPWQFWEVLVSHYARRASLRNCLIFFLTIRRTGWVWGENTTEAFKAPFPSHHTQGDLPFVRHRCDGDSHHPGEVMFALLLHESPLFPLLYCILCKQGTSLSHSQKGGCSVYTYYSEFPVWQVCLSFLTFVFMSLRTHVYLFYTLAYSGKLCYDTAFFPPNFEHWWPFSLAPVTLWLDPIF